MLGGSKVLLGNVLSMQSHFNCKILTMLKGKIKQFESFVAMVECLNGLTRL